MVNFTALNCCGLSGRVSPLDEAPAHPNTIGGQTQTPGLGKATSNAPMILPPFEKRSFGDLNLPLGKILHLDTLNSIHAEINNTKPSPRLPLSGSNISVGYERKYNLIRVYVGRKMDTINIHLSDDKSTVSKIVAYPPLTLDKFNELVSEKLFDNGFKSLISEFSNKPKPSERPIESGSQPFAFSRRADGLQNNSRPEQTSSFIEKPQQLFVLAGPGGTAFGKDLIDEISVSIKEGGRSCSTFESEGAQGAKHVDAMLRTLAEKNNSTTERPSLFLTSHGMIKEEVHYINLNGKYTRTSHLFQSVSDNTKKPLDVFMIACHGAGAFKDAHLLPKGSSVAVIAPESEEARSSGVYKLAKNIGKTHSLSAKQMLLNYCSSLENRSPPSFWKNGQKYDLDKIMMSHVGVKFIAEDKKKALSYLEPILSKSRIEELIKTIEGAKEMHSIYAVDYGPALSIIGAIHLPE